MSTNLKMLEEEIQKHTGFTRKNNDRVRDDLGFAEKQDLKQLGMSLGSATFIQIWPNDRSTSQSMLVDYYNEYAARYPKGVFLLYINGVVNKTTRDNFFQTLNSWLKP